MSHPVHRLLAALDPVEPTDRELLTRFAAGCDAGAFELLVWRHAGLVLRTCRGVLRDHHAAEDAAQAVFLALARQAGSAGRTGTVAGWLFRVARRIAARAARRRTAPAADLATQPAPEPMGTDPEAERALHEEVARLPERYRVPILLCFFEGLTHADAAQRLGVPAGTVAGRMARAKDLLAATLTRRGVALGVLIPSAVAVAPAFATATTRAAVAFAAKSYAGLPPVVLALAKREITVALMKRALNLGAVAVVACGCLAFGLRSDAQPPAAAQPNTRPAPPGRAAEKPAAIVGKTFAVAGVTTELQRKHLVPGTVPSAVVFVDGAALLRNPKVLDLEALELTKLQRGLDTFRQEKGRAFIRVLWEEPRPTDENRRLLGFVLEGAVKELEFDSTVLTNMYGFPKFEKFAKTFEDGKDENVAEDGVGDERARAYPVRTPLSRALASQTDGVVSVTAELDCDKEEWLTAEVDKSVRAAIEGLKLTKGQTLDFYIRAKTGGDETTKKLTEACKKWTRDFGLTLNGLEVRPTTGKSNRPPRK